MNTSKLTFPLSREGYVLNYLTTEAVTEPFVAPHTDKNQLKFEADMRTILAEPVGDVPAGGSLGDESSLGAPWKFYSKNRNPYIDFSVFYFTLTRVNIHAQTQLISDCAKKVRARIWSYCTVDMWLNGIHCANIKDPIYKPINHADVTLDLKEGVNDIFVALQNFGVRDTRNMFALQLYDTDGICVSLPVDDDKLAVLKDAEEWLCSVTADANKLYAKSAPVCPVSVKIQYSEAANGDGCTYAINNNSTWSDGSEFDIPNARQVYLAFEINGQNFNRTFDIVQNENLVFTDDDENARYNSTMNSLISSSTYTESNMHTHTTGYITLANYYLTGEITQRDYEIIDFMLEKIKIRIDCSDFALACLLRVYKQLPINDEYKEKIKNAALDFRYWMDEEGADAMCFWSENHALLFYACQMIAGSFWPEEHFNRSNKRGIDQYKVGLRRVKEWFDVIEHEGFEEFLAGGYMMVTIAALLMVHDFGDESVIPRAKNAIDRIVREACLQCFDGIHMAPMGRIYRSALTPNQSGLQTLLNLIDNKCAKGPAQVWLTTLLYTAYRIPNDAKELIDKATEVTFDTGRASVTTKKNKNYMLTSVASPRRTPHEDFENKETEYYKTLIMNEWFHGTSLFVPGEYGYQQHLWYAAITNQCFTFVNHPGTEKDYGGMRPDYWFGNGVFPALKQSGNTLYCYYAIPDEHPTKFTHAYWPSFAMDEEVKKDGFAFARVGDSYLALWCSEELELNNADAVQNADWRAYGDTSAWVARCGCKDEDGSFEAFMDACVKMNLSKDGVKNEIGV